MIKLLISIVPKPPKSAQAGQDQNSEKKKQTPNTIRHKVERYVHKGRQTSEFLHREELTKEEEKELRLELDGSYGERQKVECCIESCKVNEDKGGELGYLRLRNMRTLEISAIGS